MKELSLFSGIGGGLLGSHLLGWHPVAAVDFEPYCCEVLARRKADGIFKDPFDIYCMDIGEFNRRVAHLYRGKVDIITAGFPCQPFSVAGKKQGEGDERNGWPDTIECIRLVRPRYLLLENVPALLTFPYFGTILGDLSESGYRYSWKVISAAEVGAPHKRDRLWIVGNSTSSRQHDSKLRESDTANASAISRKEQLADTSSERFTEAGEYSKRPSIRTPGTGEILADTHNPGNGADGNRQEENERRERQPQHRACGPGEMDNSEIINEGRLSQREGEENAGFAQPGKDVSDPDTEGLQRHGGSVKCTGEGIAPQGDTEQGEISWWDTDPADEPESGLGRVAHGIPHRVDRLKGIGNGQVPQCMVAAWNLLSEALNE